MKKAPNIRLSLRKLLIAAMAVGPLAVLPSPVWAVLPTYNPTTNTGSFTVANGTATVTSASNVANISTSDRAVLVWNATTSGGAYTPDTTTITNFNIEPAETYNFVLPAGGAVLNRVTAGTNTSNATYAGIAAYIGGTLLSNGKVFVLSNSGNIFVANGATVNTQGGLVLSTLNEGSNGPFVTLGDLTYSGASNGTITIGTATVAGNLTAIGGSVSAAPTVVTGDMILRSVTSGSAITIGAGTVTGNLSVTTNNAAISQTGAIVVGATGGNQTTTLSSGTGSITLNAGNTGQLAGANDFQTLVIQSSGTSDVAITDRNIVTLGNSTIGRDLTIDAGGQINTNGIATAETLTVGGNASFNVTASNNSAINIANNSTIGGTVNARTAGGAITINTTGNLTTGSITSNVSGNLGALVSGASSAITGGAVTSVTLTASDRGVYASAPTVTFSDPPAGGTLATGTAIFDATTGVVSGVTITNPGAGYTSAPTVTFAPATKAAAVNGRNINVRTTGTLTIAGAVATANNATTPSVTFTGGNVAFATTGSINNQGPVTINSTAGDIVLGNITRSQRINATAVGGNISQLTGTTLTTNNGTATSAFNAGSGNITLALANNFASGHVVQFTSGNNVEFRNINDFVLGTTNVTGNVTLLAQDVTTPTATRNIQLGTGTGTGAGQNITIGGVLTATVFSAGNITDNDYSAFNVFGGLNLTSTSGDIVLNAASALGSFAPNVQFGQVNVSTTGNVTVAETTTLNLGNIGNTTAPAILPASLTAVSTAGGIVDSGNITVAGAASFTASANGSVVLDNGNNTLGSLALGGGLDNSVTNLNSSIRLEGNSLGSGNITIGTNSGRSITLGNTNVTGNLVLISGGGIDIAGNSTITGNLDMTATGNFATTPANVTAAGTLSSGAVTAFAPTAFSWSAAPTVSFSAPAATGTPVAGTVSLNATTGQANIAITTNGTLYDSTNPAIATFTGGTPTTSIAETTGSLIVSGNTRIAATGDTFLGRGNDFNVVTLDGNAVSGDRNVLINDVSNLTVSGVTLGTLNAIAGGANTTGGAVSIANPWALTLGNLTVGSLVAAAQNGGGGNSGTITQQSGTSIRSENLTSFTTRNANIVIGNNGNNFGRVQAAITNTDANRTLTIVEDGTMRVGNISSRGGTTLTSRFGSVIEDPTANVDITNNGTLTVNAANGSILLGNTTHTTGTTTGNVVTFVGSAPNGAVAIQSSQNLTLGNVTGISLVATSGNNIAQTSGGRLSIFGTSNFSAANNITVTNETNNFGRVSLTTASVSGNIAITEAGTLNLGTVTVPASSNGSFTATSVNGDIIDTGLANLRPGGTIAAVGTGVVTLNATNGNITIDELTTDFATSGGVVFNGGNVTFSVLGQTPLVLGANNTTSTATNLSVRSATGSILNAGNLSVSGDASFETGGGDITLTQTGNRFGTVRFSGRNVQITQANDINIVTGSTASGFAEFVSGSYIAIENRGGSVTFGSTANFTANGSIILPKLLQAAGTITVNSPALKDLSALSQSSDLAGRSPINLGLGEYRAPGQ